MISTIIKLHFTRDSPKTKSYPDYRKYDIDYFSSELYYALASYNLPKEDPKNI